MQNGQQDSAPNPSHGETPGVFRVGRGPAQKDVMLLFIGGLFQSVYCNIGSGRKPNGKSVNGRFSRSQYHTSGQAGLSIGAIPVTRETFLVVVGYCATRTVHLAAAACYISPSAAISQIPCFESERQS